MGDKQWFYVINNQKYGPNNETVLQELVQKGTINAATLVWQEGMSTWTALQDTTLRGIVPVGTTMLTNQVTAQVPHIPRLYTADSFNQLFLWCWILLAGSILIPFAAIGYIVIFYILLYRFWTLIQDGNPQTTPGKAAGYCFIPYYSFYWIFTAFRGLAQDMNRYCRERSIPAPVINEELALWYCIVTLGNLIPGLNILTGMASSIMGIILFNSVVKTAIAIVNTKNTQVNPAN